MSRFHRPLICVALVAALCAPARGEIESDLVKQGVAAYDNLDYQKAIELLNKALAETLTREEKVATYRTLAFSHVALGETEAARGDFENLLRADPSTQLDRRVSPRVRAVFEEARAALATRTTRTEEKKLPELTPEFRPPKPRGGEPVVVSAYYPGGVAVTLQVFYRTRGQATFNKIAGEGALGRFEVTIPGLAVEAPAIEYYAVALDDNGAAVAGAGSLAQPLALDVGERPRPVYKSGVLWGILGGVAVAGAVAGVLAFFLTRNAPAQITVIPQ